MATSRGGTPANPTLVATTDDAARGGLFARSNLGNTSGTSPTTATDTHVERVAFDDTTRMLTITLNNGTSFPVEIPGGSSGGGNFPGFSMTEVTYDSSSERLNITFADGTQREVMISPASGAGTLEDLTDTTINNRQDGQALTYSTTANAWINKSLGFTDLDDVPQTLGTVGQSLRVNTARDGLEFFTPSASGISPSEFSTNGNVTFSDDSGLIQGDATMASSAGDWNTIAVSSSLTGPNGRALELVLDSATLTLTLQETAAGPPPTPTPRGSVTPPAGSDIFEDPQPDQMTTIDVTNIMTIGNPTVTVMDPDGATITPTVTTTPVTNNMATVTITVDGSDVADPGEYDITATIPTTDEDGNAMDVTEMVNFNNFVPFVQSRSDIPDETTLTGTTGVTRSSTAWNGTVNAISGSGSLYIAVNSTDLTLSGNQFFADIGGFPRRGAIMRQVNVTAGSSTLTYNILRITVTSPATLTNFRITR